MNDQIKIQPMGMDKFVAHVPGSKSFTHRMLICAALAKGISIVENGLVSEDTFLTMKGLNQLGAGISHAGNQFSVTGTGGELTPCSDPINLNNSGTSMRLLAAVAALGSGSYTLTGSRRMQERPIMDLAETLSSLGIKTSTTSGCPPIIVEGASIAGGKASVNCGISSQYLSALMLIGPYTENGLEIEVTEGPVSKPYIDMTVSVMETMGVTVIREGYNWFSVPGNRQYNAGRYIVESDASGAGYFWAAAAITGATITVEDTSTISLQGDSRFALVLQSMGCSLDESGNGITISGGDLKGITVDMGSMPDMVPTLAVVAAFAHGETKIENVAHLKAKESDRLTSVVAELNKMGVDAQCDDAGMTIQGGKPKGAVIDTYNDHRIAMSFAVAGLVTPGVVINNPSCVEKSFPGFWIEWEKLCQGGG